MTTAAFAGAIALAAPSLAEPADPLAGMYGNTLVVTQEDGSSTRIHFRADGTWDQSDDGTIFRGTFAREGAQMCFTLVEPSPGGGQPTRECDTIEAGHVAGDKWSAVDRGKTVRYEIVKGVQ